MASDSWASSPRVEADRMANPSATGSVGVGRAKAPVAVSPLTRVAAPERQASTTSSRSSAEEPETALRSSSQGRLVPLRCSERASACPE